MKIRGEQFGLKESTMEQIQAVLFRFPEVEKAIVYGSRAKGTQKSASDIDLALSGKNLNLTIQHRIENELDDLLLPYKFDVSIFEKIANTDLVDHINRKGKEFYSRNSASH